MPSMSAPEKERCIRHLRVAVSGEPIDRLRVAMGCQPWPQAAGRDPAAYGASPIHGGSPLPWDSLIANGFASAGADTVHPRTDDRDRCRADR